VTSCATTPPTALITACTQLRLARTWPTPTRPPNTPLRSLAHRHQALTTETTAQLLITCGDNPDQVHNEATFAALRHVAPIPAPSGRTDTQRPSHDSDRQTNRALYMIIRTRPATCPTTRAYTARHTTHGPSKQDTTQC
jgi:transposase